MHIAGSQYWLESRTFEHLGLNNAFQTSVKLLTRNANATSSMPVTVNHPCLHHGYIQTLDIQPSKEYVNEQKIKVTINGQPDWSHCMDLAKEVIAVSASCDAVPCFGDSNDWVKRIRFVGLNGFHVVWSFFDLISGANLSQLEHKGQDFCNRSWDTVQKELKDVVQFETYCFRSAYLSALMHKIMGYGSTTAVHVAPESVSWPIGAAFLNIQSDWRSANSHHRKLGPRIQLLMYLFLTF